MKKISKKDKSKTPRFNCSGKDNELKISNVAGVDSDAADKVLQKATGSEDLLIAQLLLGQAYNTYNVVSPDKEKAINTSLALLQDMEPQNATQALLATQMIATHNLAMEVMRRAGLDNQTFAGVDANINRANKLLKVFVSQAEALQKLQGKSGKQKMTVEHVHVNDGGQAIIGTVESGGRGNCESGQ